METLQGEVNWQCPTVSVYWVTLHLIVMAYEMAELYTILGIIDREIRPRSWDILMEGLVNYYRLKSGIFSQT
jgi:hypothetical protein